MRYPKYPEYRDSGVEWLGEVPSHWVTWKATHGFNSIGSGTTPKSENTAYYGGDIPWITTSELRENTVKLTKQRLTGEALEDYSTLKLYPAGSLAIAMYGATIGRLGILGVDATVNQACCVFSEPEQFHTKFFFYWLWMARPYLLSQSVGGGQPNLSQDDLKQLRAPAPSTDEQQLIADFLDHKTSQLDTLIAEKQRLIDKLNEKRIALITQAVTKGLDASVPMKDSGVEWLGEVPSGWNVRRLKFVASYNDEALPDTTEPDYEIEYIDISSVSSVEGIKYTEVMFFEDAPSRARRVVQNGDTVISTVRTYLKAIAHIENAPDNLIASTGFAVIRPSEDIHPRFLAYALENQGFVDAVVSESVGVSYPAINATDLVCLPVTYPDDYSEQKRVVDFLDHKISQLDTLIAEKQRMIDKLNEYRTALITAAVTGKIDVRQIRLEDTA
ncbi:restriction endonuclease subunit S [Endozoicomonas gorgoniicola]|uniref:Restriction endonuclease subunit S n=1 Tax=Endozoicomonas gorgoniicola TaxID=1234144 RepID=A0ABT3N2Q0_9GAMM|nr:restriction endonuclease subunit S [Endozoicomonas gorgoniicola]MCW7555907.1 restriction endonuclease subunit S [Endozoicomonas gorgoniicola]